MRRFRFWIAPAVGMCVAAFVWGPFGFRSDWDGFLLGIVTAPVLTALSIILFVAMLFVPTIEERLKLLSFAIAAVLTAGTVVGVWMAGKVIDDPVRYAVWSATHPKELIRAKRHDGVFIHWDSWGMAATGDFDSYLVSDRSQRLSNAAVLSDWMEQRSKDCGLPVVDRIDTGIYVVTTANCNTLKNDIDITRD